MKLILGILLFILMIGFASFLMPVILGIIIGILMIKNGSVIGGLIAIGVGIAVNVAVVYGGFIEGGASSEYTDEECPYCGSGDTDGNHCFTCDNDF